MNGRIESYIHSDSITKNKGGALVKVSCDTDVAARTGGMQHFAFQVAKYAYAANSTVWAEIIELFPDLEAGRLTVQKELKEKIEVVEISVMKL